MTERYVDAAKIRSLAGRILLATGLVAGGVIAKSEYDRRYGGTTHPTGTPLPSGTPTGFEPNFTPTPEPSPTPTPDLPAMAQRTFEQVTRSENGDRLILDDVVIQAMAKRDAGIFGTQYIAIAYNKINGSNQVYALMMDASCVFNYADQHNLLDENGRQTSGGTTVWPLKNAERIDELRADVGRQLPGDNPGRFLHVRSFKWGENSDEIQCKPDTNGLQRTAIEESFVLEEAIRAVGKEIK